MKNLGILMLALVLYAMPSVAQANSTAASVLATVLPRAEREGVVESTEVISTSLGSAENALEPLNVPGSNKEREAATPVDIVVAHGQFTDTLAPIPKGALPPSGTIMAFTVEPQTGMVIATYVGNHSPGSADGVLSLKSRPSAGKVRAARIARRRKAVRPKAKTATWGDKCSAGNGHHCYALATWAMGSGEEVLGSETIQDTSVMDVPNWEKGDFVTNEEWSIFKNGGSSTYWTETGQIGGYGYNCCNIYAFKAWNNSNGFSFEEIGEVWKAETNYYLMHANGGGDWCWYVGPGGEYNVGCKDGFEAYSHWLEDGTEIGDEAQPENRAYAETDYVALNGEARQWNFASDGLYNEQGEQSYNGMCVAKYTPWNWPGNIYTGTYSECP
jgi:hypothetical protein